MPNTASSSPSTAAAGVFSLWMMRANRNISGNARQEIGSR